MPFEPGHKLAAKDESEKKGANVNFRVRSEERAAWQAAADAVGESFTQFMTTAANERAARIQKSDAK